MVPVFKQEVDLPHGGDNTTGVTEVVGGGNKKNPRARTTTDKNGAKRARRGPRAMSEGGTSDRSGNHTTNNAHVNGVSDTTSAAFEPKGVAADMTTSHLRKRAGEHKTMSPRAPESAAAATTMSASRPTNRSANASGMAPSAEMSLLRQAREEAKKEAEAAGSGRRPRAPSRRALEASGRLKDEGAQWMTLEKKAEQVRINAELREQRKQCKAAGLKYGVVLEAFVAGTAGTAGTMATKAEVVGGVSGDGSIGGDSRNGGGEKAAESPQFNAEWQKVSPLELSSPSLQQQANKQEDVALVTAGSKS